MKIAFVVNHFPVISETAILRQITGLLDRGHEIDIFAYSPLKDPITHRDIGKYSLLKRTYYLSDLTGATDNKIIRAMRRVGLLLTSFHKNPMVTLKALDVSKFGTSALRLSVLTTVAPFMRRGPYDVLHCQFGPIGELGLLLQDLGIFAGKLVTSFRGYDITVYVRMRGDRVYRDLFRKGDLFLCVSERIRDQLIGLGCEDRKILIHRSGVDTNAFRPRPRDPERNGNIRILTVGRLIEKKGVEYGIRAVGKILNKYPHLRYRIAGDGPLRHKLQQMIEELKAGDNIRLIGWKSQEEIAELLRGSDVLLAPSVTSTTGDEEGIPGVIMEAFAEGLPVVSTRHGGIAEVVHDGESGLLVPERNPEALAEKLEYLIQKPELRSTMGQKGRQFVEEFYNIDRLNNRLAEIYRQLLDGELPGSDREPAENCRVSLADSI